jgi:hypothetical protein
MENLFTACLDGAAIGTCTHGARRPERGGSLMGAIERAATGSNLLEVLDRVLDKGIVIDAWVRVSLVGIDLITVEANVVVASIATYLQFTEVVAPSSPLTAARSATRRSRRLVAPPPTPIGLAAVDGHRAGAPTEGVIRPVS